MSIRRKLRLGSAALFTASALAAQVLVTFDTDGLAGEVESLAPDWLLAGLVASDVTRGPGLAIASLSNGFASTGFNTGSGNGLVDAVVTGDYLQLTLAPSAGYRLSLSSVAVNLRRTSTGPSTFEWRYSFDDFVSGGTVVASFAYAGTESNGSAQAPVDLSGEDALQEVDFGETVTFRLYAAGATSAAGSLALGRLGGADLAIGGTLSAVPEPAAWAAWAGAAVWAFAGWRRRRRR